MEVTTEPGAQHRYIRREGSEETSYKLKVTVNGPGSCESQVEQAVFVPGWCPVPGDLEVSLDAVSRTTQAVSTRLSLAAGGPERFVWDWGDGSLPEETLVPSAKHEYVRAVNQALPYTVRVKVKGPGNCESEQFGPVEIPATTGCPVISMIETAVLRDETTEQEVKFSLRVNHTGPAPTAYVWHWGDGSVSENTSVPEATHVYAKRQGLPEIYDVKVESSGPDDCRDERFTEVVVPAQEVTCPTLDELKLLPQLAAETLTVEASLRTSGGSPDRYTWHWGDASQPETTTSPEASHAYARVPVDESYTVRVETHGPGSCQGDLSGTVAVPAKDSRVPLFCRFWPYLLALLAGLTLAFTVDAVAMDDLVPGTTIAGISLSLSMVMGGLLILGIILWYVLGRGRSCPPTTCDWLAIGWSMLIAGTAVVVFLISCLPGWWVAGVLYFLTGAVMAYFWFRNCAPKSKAVVFFTYFFLGLLAGVIGCFLVAGPVGAC